VDENIGHMILELIKKVKFLFNRSLILLELDIKDYMSPEKATYLLWKDLRMAEDTIYGIRHVARRLPNRSFPIFLEVGTSAKMLSIVPLMNGGGLLTGAVAPLPQHVQQFLSEGHSKVGLLGEFFGLGVSFGVFLVEKKTIHRHWSCDALELRQPSNTFGTTNRPCKKSGELDNRRKSFLFGTIVGRMLWPSKSHRTSGSLKNAEFLLPLFAGR